MVPFNYRSEKKITGETTESALRLKSALFGDAQRAWFGGLDIQFV